MSQGRVGPGEARRGPLPSAGQRLPERLESGAASEREVPLTPSGQQPSQVISPKQTPRARRPGSPRSVGCQLPRSSREPIPTSLKRCNIATVQQEAGEKAPRSVAVLDVTRVTSPSKQMSLRPLPKRGFYGTVFLRKCSGMRRKQRRLLPRCSGTHARLWEAPS